MPSTPDPPTRTERDSLGSREIPADAYFGIQTARAVENYAITGVTLSAFPHLIRALALVKKAAAHANMDLGILDREIGEAISAACDELLATISSWWT